MWEIIPLYLGAWAGIPKEPDRAITCNHGRLGEGGIAAQAGTTGETGGQLGAQDAFGDLSVDFRAAHRILLGQVGR